MYSPTRYIGDILIEELSKYLNTPIEGRTIHYGIHEINYYSETESFHIGRKKFDVDHKLYHHDTVEWAVNNLFPRILEFVSKS